MKSAAIVLAVLSLSTAGAAAASDKLNDMDYLKANRCLGLAAAMNVDTTSLNAMLKTEGRSRSEPILLRGQDELARAKHDADRASYKERLTAELNGPCMAYLGGGAGSRETATSR
ncbi:hypothetical protein [Phenylobacterium sp.]|uniref:hypothetical protein n=1 Tax=Phenylobacterium sp. TaxID=1871053 RepID=UPI0035624F9E